MSDATVTGLVTKAQSGFFWVQTGRGELICQIAGRLKKTRQPTDLVAVGDRVTVERVATGRGRSRPWGSAGACSRGRGRRPGRRAIS